MLEYPKALSTMEQSRADIKLIMELAAAKSDNFKDNTMGNQQETKPMYLSIVSRIHRDYTRYRFYRVRLNIFTSAAAPYVCCVQPTLMFKGSRHKRKQSTAEMASGCCSRNKLFVKT